MSTDDQPAGLGKVYDPGIIVDVAPLNYPVGQYLVTYRNGVSVHQSEQWLLEAARRAGQMFVRWNDWALVLGPGDRICGNHPGISARGGEPAPDENTLILHSDRIGEYRGCLLLKARHIAIYWTPKVYHNPLADGPLTAPTAAMLIDLIDAELEPF